MGLVLPIVRFPWKVSTLLEHTIDIKADGKKRALKLRPETSSDRLKVESPCFSTVLVMCYEG